MILWANTSRLDRKKKTFSLLKKIFKRYSLFYTLKLRWLPMDSPGLYYRKRDKLQEPICDMTRYLFVLRHVWNHTDLFFVWNVANWVYWHSHVPPTDNKLRQSLAFLCFETFYRNFEASGPTSTYQPPLFCKLLYINTRVTYMSYFWPVVPPENNAKGGQKRPVKILGWRLKIKWKIIIVGLRLF